MQTHLMGKKHKNRVAQSQGQSGIGVQATPVQGNVGGSQFWCDVCKISTTDQSSLDSHTVGKKHMKKLALLGLR